MDSLEDEIEQIMLAIEEMVTKGIASLAQDPENVVTTGLVVKIQGPDGLSIVIALPGTIAFLPDEIANNAVREVRSEFAAMSLPDDCDAEVKH